MNNTTPEHEKLFDEICNKLNELSHRDDISLPQTNKIEKMQTQIKKFHSDLLDTQDEFRNKIKTLENLQVSKSEHNTQLRLLTEQLQSGCINRYTETVNIVPMLAANAALSSGQATPVKAQSEFRQRLANSDRAAECLSGSSWSPVRLNDTTHSAILLAASNHASIQQTAPDTLQSHFRKYGIALSAYPSGLLRMSMPLGILQQSHLDSLSNAFHAVSHHSRSK